MNTKVRKLRWKTMMVKSVDTISRAKSQASTLDSIRNSCGVFIRRRIPYQIWYISKSSMWVVKVVACGVGSFKPFEISLNSVLFVGFYCLTGLKDKYSSDRPKRWESWKENIWILILWIKRRSLSFTLTVSGSFAPIVSGRKEVAIAPSKHTHIEIRYGNWN